MFHFWGKFVCTLRQECLVDILTQRMKLCKNTYDICKSDKLSSIMKIAAADGCAPFGVGNHKPIFAIEVVPDDVQIFGKTKNHTKLKLQTPSGNIDAIAFFKLPEDFSNKPESLKPLTLLAHIERSHFMGRLETRLRIVDIL